VARLFESIIALQALLTREAIPSAVIGGIAVGVWGEPRVTRDVDIKILLGRDDAFRLLDILRSGYTPLQPDPMQALTRTGILFVKDQLGTRIDLLLSDTEFDRGAVKRAVPVELEPGLTASICRPEDLIIYKLISTRLRDHEDAASVLRRQRDTLDDRYVLDWLDMFEQALDDSTLVEEFRSLRENA
jgi:hypothetical protein